MSPPADLRISTVRTTSDLSAFIELPWRIYRNDPNWVPPLKREVRRVLDARKHPFWEFSDRELFLAWRGREVVGRIAAIVDRRHNERYDEKLGIWGFFECSDDLEASTQLFRAVETWVRSRNMELLRGPLNPSLNYEAGLLVENFAYPPTLGFAYNPPFYPRLVEDCGFQKLKDLLTFWVDKNLEIPDWVLPLAEELKGKRRIWIRQGDVRDYTSELNRIMQLYNAAWDKNWGFVPVTPAEARAIEKTLRPMIDPQLVTFVYHENEPVGVGFALPDWNLVLRHLGGRIGPLGLLKVLLYRRRIRGLRGFIFGVKEEYRGLGIPFLAFEHVYRRWRNRYHFMELGWILEDNVSLLQFLEAAGLKAYRRYRIYQKAVE